MDTFKTIQQHWQYKHLKFLRFFLEHHQDYYEGSFTYERGEGGDILIDHVVQSDDAIIGELANYYEDTGDYATPFGDFIYLVFTDMVEDSVDILSTVAKEDVA